MMLAFRPRRNRTKRKYAQAFGCVTIQRQVSLDDSIAHDDRSRKGIRVKLLKHSVGNHQDGNLRG
jgi:hypothetical protein